MVDTGTIISQETLHDVNRYLKQEKCTLPPLELPTVQLWEGHNGGQELLITAQVPLVFNLGTKIVSVPVFIQQTVVRRVFWVSMLFPCLA